MSKSEANEKYKKELEIYKKKTWPEYPTSVVFGSSPGNIGNEIHRYLNTEISSTEYSYMDFNLPKMPEDFCRYDAFVFNNAVNHLDWIENWSEGDIVNVVQNSLTATMVAISKIAKGRLNSKHRTKIVVIGSMAHKAVLNGSAPYCAAKAGLMHFVRCAAYELAPKGFEIFCVNPSNVQNAPMSNATVLGLARYRNMTIDDAWKYWGNECPMGEFLTKGEIAELVTDLIVRDMKYLSGSAIDLIGGQR